MAVVKSNTVVSVSPSDEFVQTGIQQKVVVVEVAERVLPLGCRLVSVIGTLVDFAAGPIGPSSGRPTHE
jgi:hypothetical protein